uniref:Putative cell wall hydrolase n=1 Tax=viral metagenome TaxID=1070528 RepID=A0A6M3XNP8_9ZZZZ
MTKEEHANLIKLIERLPIPLKIALTVYGEARGESEQGKVAVAWVCLNREADSVKWNDITDPFQFSCWNLNDPNLGAIMGILPFNLVFAECLDIAYGVYFGKLHDPTGGATNYYAPAGMPDKNPPYWAKDMQITKAIGGHIFLKA